MTQPQSCIVGIALLRTRGATDPTLPSAPAASPTTSVVSLMSGSAILGQDTVGWDLGLSEGILKQVIPKCPILISPSVKTIGRSPILFFKGGAGGVPKSGEQAQ